MVKSYKGGYSILDTTPIAFELEDSGVAITDTYILEQLLEILKPHYYNWIKDIKPIYLRYISDSVGVCVALCTLIHQSDNEFLITANLSHDTIEIYVELTEDVDGNILINDCTYTYLTLTQVVNSEITGGNIEVGTKLYQHDLDNGNDTHVYVVNNSSESITSITSAVFLNAISVSVLDDDGNLARVIAVSGTNTLIYYQVSDSDINAQNIIPITDTVTPL